MRSEFPGYYRRTDEELGRIWEDGIFVLDTNVLLNLYRYSEGTREELLGVLRGVRDRLWIPHQVAEEFLRNRQTVIRDRKNAYSAVKRSLSNARNDVKNKMGEMHTDPGIIEAKDLLKRVEESFSKLIHEADELEQGAAIQSIQETDSPNDDEIWQAVEEIFEDRIGEGLPPRRKQEVLGMGPRRYESRIPPGFKDQDDKSKPSDRQFGDLILWFETIEEARATGNPVLLVTDDRKEDWWLRSGKEFSPHPELGNEMHREAGVLFHMFMPLDFVKWAGPKLNQEISSEAAGEIEELWPLEDAEKAADLLDQEIADLFSYTDYDQVIGVEDPRSATEDLLDLKVVDLDTIRRRWERLDQHREEDPSEYQRKVERLKRLNREKALPPGELLKLERLLRKLDLL